MNILIACEESQIVCTEFRKLGHEAYSCDIEPCSGGHPEWHIQGDVLQYLNCGWDLMIAHPPCTYLSNVGARWFSEEKYGKSARDRKQKRLEAFDFVMKLANANIARILIENLVGYLNSHWRKPDQIIQPYYFGDHESKRTCIWLKGLPLLKCTKMVKPRIYGYKKNGEPIYFEENFFPSNDRSKKRSRTFPGIARAIAEQYSKKGGE